MNQSDSRGSIGQSADLRDRLADVIWAALRTQHNVVNFHALADAVIRELGLRQETRHEVVPHVGIVTINPETFTTAGDHRQETRYVTEWGIAL